ncbi:MULTISPECIES: hypothetical protein [unclassified Olleya]|jgi:hypothetical protein|uniref:hypothetical protein n=1 Tax=unclassified Olleya TaxID=2615019 RepID=UPI0011A4E564|nr:hypothetical protein [Olleya sp. Hel_I_94]TVZ47409.1 hypothetical protein JM82_2016 [Olleya sp. Hel_I_94]|tara:strand:+ start:182523 stop:183092 length:570 start_codon:yes stop_codon:yes gene_type:complete
MTRQIRDKLIYENQEYYLNTELIELYFRQHPEKRPKFEISCSALWRGYVAIFEVKNNKLLIKELDWLTDINFNMQSFRDELFPNNKFEWYSGLIRIDEFRGEFDKEPENGIFEYLEIENGNLIQKRTFNFEELQRFKKEQYDYFLLSDEVESLYEFWGRNNENGVINKESVNKIILKNIMEYTQKVYVE